MSRKYRARGGRGVFHLTPWVGPKSTGTLVARISRGDRSWRTVTMGAAAFAGMILVRGWYVVVWSLLFMTFACLLCLGAIPFRHRRRLARGYQGVDL